MTFDRDSGIRESLRLDERVFTPLGVPSQGRRSGEAPIPFELAGEGGGAPSIFLAASDASDESKSKADLVCNGTADEQVIKGALTDLSGGRVLLSEGTFDVALVSEIFVGAGEWLQGLSHRATILSYSGAANNAAIVEMQGGARVSNLRIEEGTGDTSNAQAIDATTGTGPAIVDNVEISVNGIGVVLGPDYSILSDSWIDNGTSTAEAVNIDGDDIYVNGNYLTGGGVGIDITAPSNRALIGFNRISVTGNAIDDAASDTRYPYATVLAFSQGGTLAIGSGAFKWPMPPYLTMVVVDAQGAVGTAPSGGAVTLDVNKNGTTMYATATNPSIASGQVVGSVAAPDYTELTTDDYLTVDVDAANSAADLTVVVRVLPV